MINPLAILLLMTASLAIGCVNKPSIVGDKAMGKCHPLNKSYDTVFLTDDEYKTNNEFDFVINAKDSTAVKADISNDQLINIRRQLITAHDIYQNVLGLTSPLDTPRYQQAKMIRVILAPITHNGLSFDEVITDNNASQCYVAIKIKSTLKHTNLTPAHELFHVYQNSYFMFKNNWLTEGTAQWSETLLNDGKTQKVSSRLPQTRAELEEVMTLSYNASSMWNRLFQLVDGHSAYQIPKDLQNLTYTNNEIIIKNNHAYGTNFIQPLFESLEALSHQAAQDKGLPAYNWQEAEQKSPDNNHYIWRAVQNAINNAVPKAQQSEELKRFVSISLL